MSGQQGDVCTLAARRAAPDMASPLRPHSRAVADLARPSILDSTNIIAVCAFLLSVFDTRVSQNKKLPK